MVFDDAINAIRIFIAGIGAIIIALSAMHSIYLFLLRYLGNREVEVNHIRLEFGYGIILGLEFMVGSDIIRSMAKPTYYDVGLLGLLVVIRTFLSYFLSKELADLSPRTKKLLH